MADRSDKVKGSASGPYYVDGNCIDCNLCREIAPEFFERSDEAGLSLVYKQPHTDQERERCDEAKEYCPVDAIGNDGE
ncbi:MAG TPA: ferredoxin [Blastocatellia bacterium]|nr:ferredoxin [Blastocatellia bacterium]